ncbi:PREDICTED: uncharacterized protein LOC106747764 isoform X2 [Dinoponera quadriceps]|uniref:Uncharacterized protein LOC106747764 isoform X2 n=1 Tax=Dinoponera quadriceps TaxID=609295 RepID=A0A6P3XSD3_DINQU|nr:PREDICTED: uncharacterized protein LOC106747764 isoform X2 [Dinoponera quadriceps]
MSSTIDERPTRVPEEMNLSYRQDNATTRRHVGRRFALDAMSSKFPTTHGSYTKCNDRGAFSRTVSSEKDDDAADEDNDDDVMLVVTLRSERPDNAARLSWNALPSSSAFSTDRCSPSQEHDRPVYNDSTMKHRGRSPRWKCDARIYSHLFSSVYSITKNCYRRVFRSHSLWRYDHPRGSDFSRIFLPFVCIFFLMMHMTVHADSIDSIATIDDTDFIDTYTPISKKPCVQGLSTPGVTRPYGDINIEYGTKPLRIMCILDPERVAEKYPGKTSADLYFLRDATFVDRKFISIINETAILLEIPNPEPSKALYTCGLRVDTGFHNVAVCLNEVAIGHKPTKPISFNCVSDNWESLHCSWVPVRNYVKTTYNLTFTLPGKRSRKIFPCPKDINETNKDDTKKLQDVGPIDKNSCYWDTKTNPIYRQPYETYTFILFAFNPFENASFTYKMDHFSNVIPRSPWDARVINIRPDSARLRWSLPFPLQNFPAGVHHRIMYQNQLHSNSKNATWTVINITDKVREEHKEYLLTNLDCGYCEFDVRILLKSATAEDVERMWSKPAVIKFRTMSSAPSFPPRTDIGSFEIVEIDDKSRDVFLYWQRIPQNHQNGENFMYEVDYVEKNGVDANLKNRNSTVAYVKYNITTDSKYLFKIASKNEVGPSSRSEIIVPTQSEVISLEPNAFTKIAYNETLYELSWKPPISENIKNYTIFWCEDIRDRPYQCTGYLDWVHVPKNTTMYNVTVSNPSKVYQFAISSNTERTSSGMVWASCTVIHNKVTSKMKDVWINSIGSRSIEVGWKLDCSDRVGIIDGFNIYYCPIISPYKQQCQENTRKNITIVAGPHTIHGTARELQPYTTYMLYVTVLTKFGEGSNSDSLFNTTLEDAPSTPPQDLQVVNVTNTTITLEWKPPQEMNGVLRYYEVRYNGRVLKVEDADVLSIQVTDLEPYTKYNISVRACTISCSNVTSVEQITEIGIPGKIHLPYVYSTNGSEVVLKWYQPKNSGGPVHYYEIILHNNQHIQYTNASEIRLSIPDCKDVSDPQEPSYLFRVRAVNIVNETQLKGPWSDPVEVNCHSDAWLMICITGIIGIGVFFSCLVYGSRRMWSKCRAMQDVEVKLPPGLAPNIKLLPSVGEQHMRQPSADSSGCSSAQDSVTSSLTTNSQVSNDSGTDMASDPASPDKLLESLPSWESKRVRQRNVGNARSTENGQWESYVKVAKSGEPVLGETLSLTRSTPNLTESAGCTTSQHTWSSTGYISMPSSEEASSNPSPVPRENPFIVGAVPGTAANYSVVGSMPKQSKPCEEPTAGGRTAVGDALITLQMEATKSSKPYIALSALEKKLKKSKHAADTLDLDELTFVEPDKCNNNPDAQAPSQFDPDADKISKPYVQTGLIDTLEKQYLLKPIVDTKRNLLCGSFMSTGSHGKPFAPASFLPSFPPTPESATSSKPYVAVSSITEEMTPTSPAHAANESRRPYVQHAIPALANSKFSSKPYTLASLQQQREKADLCARMTDDDESCKKVDDKSAKVEPNRPVFAKQSTGYVTLAENPSLGKLKPAPKQLEKPAQQPSTTTSQSADGQYSKVTVVPSTM